VRRDPDLAGHLDRDHSTRCGANGLHGSIVRGGGRDIPVSSTVLNQGNGTAGQSWNEQVFVSTDNVFDGRHLPRQRPKRRRLGRWREL